MLAAGIVIPKIFGIDVSDVELDFFDGYLSFGATITQEFWEYVSYFMVALKEEIQMIKLQQAAPYLFEDHKMLGSIKYYGHEDEMKFLQ